MPSREGKTLTPLPQTLFQAMLSTFYCYLVQEKLEAQTEWVPVGRYRANKGTCSKSCSAELFLWASVSQSVK